MKHLAMSVSLGILDSLEVLDLSSLFFSLLFSVENPIGWKGVAILAESVLRGNHLRALRVLILHCLFT